MTSPETQIRVYYEDTDAGGIVYHANYLKFAERARTDWLRACGFEQSKLKEEEGVILIVHHLEITFLSPARLDDLLNIETHLTKLSKVSMILSQTIQCGTKKIATLTVSIACVNTDWKPTRWPPGLYAHLNEGM